MKWLSIFYKTTYAHFPTSRHGIQRLLHSSAFTIIPVKKVKVSISIPLIGFPSGPAGKESACNAGDLGFIPGLGRFPGEGNGYPLQYSGLENSRDCIVHRVAKSQALLSDFHFHSINSDSARNPPSLGVVPNLLSWP